MESNRLAAAALVAASVIDLTAQGGVEKGS